MVNNSRSVLDAQQGIHKNLLHVVQKHLDFSYRKPIAKHTQDAFSRLNQQIGAALKNRPLILDSCCGTAMSTRLLAEQHPDALVIGIDRSATRLGKAYNAELPENAYIVQAECGDFWRLAQSAGWRLQKHCLFYPNPYPKAKHLKRRWHAHPAFPALLALGGEVELRTNWKVYADEFCAAIHYAQSQKDNTIEPARVAALPANTIAKPMTLFEKKYAQTGQLLYACKYRLY